jgi:hypothetical protein
VAELVVSSARIVLSADERGQLLERIEEQAQSRASQRFAMLEPKNHGAIAYRFFQIDPDVISFIRRIWRWRCLPAFAPSFFGLRKLPFKLVPIDGCRMFG